MAGFVDELTSAGQLMAIANTRARDALKLDANAHRESKLKMRQSLLITLEKAIDRDCEDWRHSYPEA